MEFLLDASPVWAAGAVTAGATLALGWLAVRLGWVDRRVGDSITRKPRVTPVPLVGGAALLAGILAGGFSSTAASLSLPWSALVAAFLLGLVDDLRDQGLSALTKFAGQGIVSALLALDPALSVPFEAGPRALVFVVAWVAQNAINTYDNADGAAVSLSLVGLFPVPLARGALLGFLPFNAFRGRAGRAPWAYLGDSGSHLLGVWVAAVPAAWPVLILPVLDLARLARLRLARGRAPWQGDRCHLAHRMEAAGWPAPMVAFTLAAVAAMPVLGAYASAEGAVAGVLGCVLSFFVLVAGTPDPESE